MLMEIRHLIVWDLGHYDHKVENFVGFFCDYFGIIGDASLILFIDFLNL